MLLLAWPQAPFTDCLPCLVPHLQEAELATGTSVPVFMCPVCRSLIPAELAWPVLLLHGLPILGQPFPQVVTPGSSNLYIVCFVLCNLLRTCPGVLLHDFLRGYAIKLAGGDSSRLR